MAMLDAANDAADLYLRQLHELGPLADAERARRFGRRALWVNNVHINTTNICAGTCRFCHYRRKTNDPDAFALTVEQVVEQAALAAERGAREAHLVGGLNQTRDLAYYLRLTDGLARRVPQLYRKFLTAVEIDFLAQQAGVTVEEVLQRLRDAGLQSLAGGGAEIFSPRVRMLVCPEKIDADRWLAIHRAAHHLGIRSNATMLFGHVESPAERVEHLLRLRDLQAETNGFQSFLALPVVDFDGGVTGGVDVLKTLAISRLVLDNFDHIKVFWPIWTSKLAQLGLTYGADDFDGTVGRYRIVGAELAYEAGMSPQALETLIRQAGLEPAERTGDYHIIDHKGDNHAGRR